MVGLIKAVASILVIDSGSLLANARPIVLKPRSTNNSETFSIKAPLVLQTSSGIVHGAINESVPLTRNFLGIPCAQSTFGENRFRKAQPLPASAAQQIIHADAFNLNYPQYEATPASVYTDVRREYFIQSANGDGCLSVSVWAPLYPTKDKVPVIVWIYGGGQTTGGSSVPYQNPQRWVQRTQSHIVVSLQYRLNFFAALEWIRDNIAAFGGDPSSMVLWGQSAGATLTGAPSTGWPDDPIVTGFIQDSGAVEGQGVHTVYTDTTHSNFTFLANELGCTGSTTSQVECMSTYPQADIEAFIQYWTDAGKTPALIDGASTAALSSGPPNIEGPTPEKELAATLHVRCGVVAEAQIRQSLNATTYRFEYSDNFSNLSPLPFMGAYHSSGLPMSFGTYADVGGDGTRFQKNTSEAMQDLCLTFARDPENGLSNAGWPKYEEGSVEVLGGEQNGTQVTHYATPKAGIEDACLTYT
ncbi:putative chlorogenic acid esterase precursor protein [Botrytis fragariae]|uniref:Carboxylic ester hydrolase n=1 Tax=Botrytis fragariae TaxID=1964551 RepID=A0A8H6B255_9HELO|nr:putative chlorogenic acid esterase precursor protein [Botrytis fragariae]KAF5878063.1 putative chlorogenic acid esterase precursor protein [Botrytis fragariae]